MAKIVIYLKTPEEKALRELAELEYRDPRAQAAFIVTQELERRGFLAVTEPLAPALPAQEASQGGMNVAR